MQTPITPPPQTATFFGCGLVSIDGDNEERIRKNDGNFRCRKFPGTEMNGNGSTGVNNISLI